MVAGQQNKVRIAFIIQARMKSSRLPGKVLLPLPFNTGKPIIQWIVDAISLSQYLGDIIIATSKDQENDVLCRYCEANSISYYRGDEQDVLSRFVAIVKEKNYDAVVRLTADNPVVDINYLDQTLANHFEQNNDYTKTEGLPTGMNFEIVSPASLLLTETEDTTDEDKEHVTSYIRNSGKFKTETIVWEVNDRLKDKRLTIDYSSDYLTLSAILSLAKNETVTGVDYILSVLDDFPWIFEANQNNFQKKQYTNLKDELKAAEQVLEKLEFKAVAKILNSYEA
jgi:spore coat polysaccharide biosynthesis protein SpsF